jgi:hypothetical protein
MTTIIDCDGSGTVAMNLSFTSHTRWGETGRGFARQQHVQIVIALKRNAAYAQEHLTAG